MSQKVPIGQLLVERGLADPATVERAASAAHAGEDRICSRLLEMGACREHDLAGVLAERFGVPGVDLSRTVVDLAALDLVPSNVARSDLILPLSLEGGRLHLAAASPQQIGQVVEEVRFVTGREISVYVGVLGALRRAIELAYGARERGEAVWRGDAAVAGQGPHVGAVFPPQAGSAPARPEPASEASVEVVDAGEVEEVVHTVSVRVGQRRVLVVDDEPTIRLLVQRTLEGRGFQVDVAGDGEEALEKARSAPDLVLLDAMLPKLHGFEVARRLRADPATRQIPLIIMTAVYRGWRFAQDARDSYGAQDYIEKPFRVDDLLRRVDAVLESMDTRRTSSPSAEVTFRRGQELLLAGQLDGAITAFEEAVRLDPFRAESHYQLGKTLKARGEHFRAMTAFEHAADLRPDMFPALRSLAGLYLDKGFRAKAAETLERAVRAAPDDATRDALREDLLQLL